MSTNGFQDSEIITEAKATNMAVMKLVKSEQSAKKVTQSETNVAESLTG